MSTLYIVKKNQDFQTVFKKGHSIYGRYMVVSFLPNEQNFSRFGFCVGKKLGTAVIRNRNKRLLREAARNFLSLIIPGYDVVIVARHPILISTLPELINELKFLLKKASILNEN